jgi:hypothetical protein
VNLLVFVDPEVGDYVSYTVFRIVDNTYTIVDGSVEWLPMEAGALQVMKHGKQATFEQGNVSATWQASGDYYTVGDATDRNVSPNQIETTKSEYTQRAAHALVTAFGRVFNSAGPECAGSLNTATISDLVATTTTRIK